MQNKYHSQHKNNMLTNIAKSWIPHGKPEKFSLPSHSTPPEQLRKFHPLLAICMALSLLFSGIISTSTASAASKTPLIILSTYSRTMKIGQEFRLHAVTSNLSLPSYSSSKRSIASVDSSGLITAKKAGSCKISVKSGKSIAYCKLTISKTTISLNNKSISMEHGATFKLTAKTSNGTTPTYKSNKKSVATVSENGKVTAIKPGNAIITVKADQTEVQCKVNVKKPIITLSAKNYTLHAGDTQKINAKVSSGLDPVWSSSKSSVAFVDQSGDVTAVKSGTATIKAKLDGVIATCVITVQ